MKNKLVLAFCVGLIAVMVWAAGNVVPPSSGGASLGTSALWWLNQYVANSYVSNLTVYTTMTIPADTVNSNNLVVGDYGDVSVAADGTVTLDNDVVAPAEMADGDFGAFTFASGVAGMDAEGTPLTALADGIVGSLTVATTPVSATQATVTVTMKDINGSALTVSKGLEFWFTTAAIDSVASTNGIESWSFVSHGDVRRHVYNGTGIVSYYGTTHTDGTMDFLVTCEAGPFTNRFAAWGPNGCYSNLAVRYVAP